MSSSSKSSSGSPIFGIVIGAALMFGGFWFSKNVHLAFIEQLEGQGIPLDPGKTISIIGVFLILFPIVRIFFITPLAEAIGSRTTELEKTFSEVEGLRAEMSTMKADYEQRLTATEASAREQIQAQIKEAQNLRTQLMAEAAAKAGELVKRAQAEIEQEKQRVIGDLRLEVVNLTLLATEKVLGENIDSEKNRKLVNEFIERVEVAR